jgi:hypothetical protein
MHNVSTDDTGDRGGPRTPPRALAARRVLTAPAARLALVAALAAGLAACGGSGGGDTPPVADSNTVPATATASAEAFTGYAAGLAEDDRREPLNVDGLVPPTSETAEPLPVTR